MRKMFEVLPPMMPNFVRFKKEAGLRQDGFKVDEGFPIENFTKEEAQGIRGTNEANLYPTLAK